MKLLKSKAGFTLIELLVVIGILAVLAAIAIPSVAGLIDRANVSADKTNANEMTNAVERFTSEYELYCQDIASGAIKDADNNGVPDDMDAAQGRVFNVTGAVTRGDITTLESTGLDGKQINRDTKYPTNMDTLKAIVENYTKTSSATFEPKQSDCSFWYNPDCGVVVVAETDSDYDELNALIQSGMDAKGNSLVGNTNWNNVTTNTSNEENTNAVSPVKWGRVYVAECTEGDILMEDEARAELEFIYFYLDGDNSGRYGNGSVTYKIEYSNGDIVLKECENFDNWGEALEFRCEGRDIILEADDRDIIMTVSADGKHIYSGYRTFTLSDTLSIN